MSAPLSAPLVSIIVPTRNRPEVLKYALQGIHAQRYEPYEVLIMDDGSEEVAQERYPALLANFDARFKLHLRPGPCPTGSGPSTIRNAGIRLAEGKYVAFCDDDDQWIDPDFLCQATAALDETAADLLLGNQKTAQQGEIVSEEWLPKATAAVQPELELKSAGVYRLQRWQVLQRPGYAHLNFTIASKRLLDQVGGFWESVRFAEDVDLYVRLADRCETILYRPLPCAIHNAPDNSRETASSSVTALDQRLIEELVYQHLLTNCRSREALDYIKSGSINNEKSIFQHLLNENRSGAAALLARRILGTDFTLKWFLYTAWLSLRARFSA